MKLCVQVVFEVAFAERIYILKASIAEFFADGACPGTREDKNFCVRIRVLQQKISRSLVSLGHAVADDDDSLGRVQRTCSLAPHIIPKAFPFSAAKCLLEEVLMECRQD